jgi:filamentous hemagglutinin family protein
MVKKRLTLICKIMLALVAQRLYGNPTEPTVVGGQVAIEARDPSELIIHQTTNKAIINWQNFSIAPTEVTRFVQPPGGITLNRVVGPHCSEIAGTLSANGEVWLLNPSGILFNSSSFIDVPRFIATTLQINNEDFMRSHYEFTQSKEHKPALISVEGMKVRDSGIVALVAPGVEVRGRIEARLGKVILGSGTQMTVDLFGDHLINLGVGTEANQEGINIRETGSIITEAGTVLLTTSAAEEIVQNLINMDGVIKADSALVKEGEIILTNSTSEKRTAKASERVTGEIILKTAGAHKRSKENHGIAIRGKLSTQGLENTPGGKITLTADRIGLLGKAELDASGALGGGVILIGGDYLGGGTLPRAEATFIGKDVTIKADALTHGNGGKVIVWSDKATQVFGEITARGGQKGGQGGFIETSGGWLNFAGRGTVSAPKGKNGTWLFDPFDVEISSDKNANGFFIGLNPVTWIPNGAPSIVNSIGIQNLLNAGTDVTITTAGAFNMQLPNAMPGNIMLTSSIFKTAGGNATLSLVAEGSIIITQPIIATVGELNLDFRANAAVAITNVPIALNTNGGDFFSQSATFSIDGGNIAEHSTLEAGNATIVANTALIPYVDGVKDVVEFTVHGLNLGIRDSIVIKGGRVAGVVDGAFLRDPRNNPHIRDLLSPFPDGNIPAANPATTAIYFGPSPPPTHIFNETNLFFELTGPLLPVPTPPPTVTVPPNSVIPTLVNTVVTLLTNPVPPVTFPIQPPTPLPQNPFQPTQPLTTPSSAPSPNTAPLAPPRGPSNMPTNPLPNTAAPPTMPPQLITTLPVPTLSTPNAIPTPSVTGSIITTPVGPSGLGGVDVPLGVAGIGSGPKETFRDPDEGHVAVSTAAIVGLAATPRACGECEIGDPGCEKGKDPEGGNCVKGVNSYEAPVEMPILQKGVGPMGVAGIDVPLGIKGIGSGPQEQANIESLADKGLKGLLKEGIEGINIEKILQNQGNRGEARIIIEEMGPRIDGVNINVNGEGESNSEAAGRIP